MTDELNVNAEAEKAEEITNHVEEVQVTEEPKAEVEPTQETRHRRHPTAFHHAEKIADLNRRRQERRKD